MVPGGVFGSAKMTFHGLFWGLGVFSGCAFWF